MPFLSRLQSIIFRRPASLRLLFVGDIMVHDKQLEHAARPDGRFDFDRSFEVIAPILKSADLTIGNLEGPLPGGPPYNGYPSFRTPDALAEALKQAGFDVLVTANNHMTDAGPDALRQTVRTLKRMGFYQTGTFESPEQRETDYPLLIERKGFRLALLNATYRDEANSGCTSLINIIDEAQLKRDLASARSTSPDAVIVFLHWGTEYEKEPGVEQRALAAKLREWGASIIVGAHPHVVQPVESGGCGAQNVVTAFSLGNFVSNQRYKHTDGGLMLEIELRKPMARKKAVIGRVAKRYVWRYLRRTDGGGMIHTVVPIAEAEAGKLDGFEMPADSWVHMREFMQGEDLTRDP